MWSTREGRHRLRCGSDFAWFVLFESTFDCDSDREFYRIIGVNRDQNVLLETNRNGVDDNKGIFLFEGDLSGMHDYRVTVLKISMDSHSIPRPDDRLSNRYHCRHGV